MIVGCGTSYHAALAGRIALERWARIPVEADLASEFRHRDPLLAKDSLVIGITQSGETADTLAAMRLARARGATVIALTNVPGSQATIDADGVLLTRAGIEIGVAATKTFVAQVAALYALALRLAQLHGALGACRAEGARRASSRCCRRGSTRSSRLSSGRSPSWPSDSRAANSSCTWAACPGCRSRSRAR